MSKVPAQATQAKLSNKNKIGGDVHGGVHQTQQVTSNVFIKEEVKLIGDLSQLDIPQMVEALVERLRGHGVPVLQVIERFAIEYVLKRYLQQNVAAQVLGISQRAMNYKIHDVHALPVENVGKTKGRWRLAAKGDDAHIPGIIEVEAIKDNGPVAEVIEASGS